MNNYHLHCLFFFLSFMTESPRQHQYQGTTGCRNRPNTGTTGTHEVSNQSFRDRVQANPSLGFTTDIIGFPAAYGDISGEHFNNNATGGPDRLELKFIPVDTTQNDFTIRHVYFYVEFTFTGLAQIAGRNEVNNFDANQRCLFG